jgi:hypothetical protein
MPHNLEIIRVTIYSAAASGLGHEPFVSTLKLRTLLINFAKKVVQLLFQPTGCGIIPSQMTKGSQICG